MRTRLTIASTGRITLLPESRTALPGSPNPSPTKRPLQTGRTGGKSAIHPDILCGQSIAAKTDLRNIYIATEEHAELQAHGIAGVTLRYPLPTLLPLREVSLLSVRSCSCRGMTMLPQGWIGPGRASTAADCLCAQKDLQTFHLLPPHRTHPQRNSLICEIHHTLSRKLKTASKRV